MRTIALIPARAGSKRLPNKNFKEFAGSNLVVIAIEQAKRLAGIDIVVLNSENSKILDFGKEHNVATYIRSDALSTDAATTNDLVCDFLTNCSSDDLIVLLQTTSPLRLDGDIEKAIDLYKKNSHKSIISVSRVSERNTQGTGVKHGIPRTLIDSSANQLNNSDEYYFNGEFYISLAEDLFINNGSFVFVVNYFYVSLSEGTIDIDFGEEFDQAEVLYLKERASIIKSSIKPL